MRVKPVLTDRRAFEGGLLTASLPGQRRGLRRGAVLLDLGAISLEERRPTSLRSPTSTTRP